MKRGSSYGSVLPKFFKVYLPEESEDDLELPTSYNIFLPKSLPRTVTVRSIYGKSWKMVLRKCDGHDVERYVLVNGWKRIVEEESLKERDFLAFAFDGSRCFKFCIFDGTTTCKRLGSRSMETNVVKSESDHEDEAEDDDDDGVAAEDDNDRRKLLDNLKNLSFTLTLTTKISRLRIPAMVIKDYNLQFPECITIIDPLAKKFGTLKKPITIEANGAVFVRDFGSIIRRNQVKGTDEMIVELKKTGDNLVHTMKLYVIKG